MTLPPYKDFGLNRQFYLIWTYFLESGVYSSCLRIVFSQALKENFIEQSVLSSIKDLNRHFLFYFRDNQTVKFMLENVQPESYRPKQSGFVRQIAECRPCCLHCLHSRTAQPWSCPVLPGSLPPGEMGWPPATG